VFKPGSLRWLGQLCRLQEQDPCRQLTFHKSDGTRQVGRPAIRWLDSVEESMKTTSFRNWRQKLQELDQWRAVVEGGRVHSGL